MRGIYLRLTMPAPSERKRARALDRLMANLEPPVEIADWRASVLRLAAGSEPAASLANHLLANEAGGASDAARPQFAARAAWVYLASPLHTRASMTSVHLPADGVLTLDAEVALRLAADFGTVFAASGWTLVTGASGRLYLLSDRTMDARTFDPDLARDQEIEPWFARGADASKLRALGSEIEMWLFAHPSNAARKTAGLQPFTMLWPWADGALELAVKPVRLRLEGDDSLLAAASHPDGSTLTVYAPLEPGSSAWAGFERDQLLPAARALRNGDLGFIALSCGPIEYTLRRFSRYTRWRRLRPWWDYFGIS